MGELESLCGAAGIPVPRLSGNAKKEKMVEDLIRNLACFREAGSGGSSFGCKTDCVCGGAAGCVTCEAGSSSSSGPQRSTHQSSQQLREEGIFKQNNRLKEELENKTKEELVALGTTVLHAHGEDWMREQLSCRDRDLVKKFARKVGIRVESLRHTKLKNVLIDELVQLFIALCDSALPIMSDSLLARDGFSKLRSVVAGNSLAQVGPNASCRYFGDVVVTARSGVKLWHLVRFGGLLAADVCAAVADMLGAVSVIGNVWWQIAVELLG
eukprot:s3207_g7.t1